ncbi:hypothetical protein GCM10023186_46250 [Hymenobacter koreensis]|uniref:Uncharacterized protein n=1 Tax=Hymenobacter koreensis TaxID=1084523 RepID=A0ABP8JQB1_9BACT
MLLESLLRIPGIQQAEPFYFLDDQAQSARSEVLVHPAHGWAIALDLPQFFWDRIGLGVVDLAGKLCEQYAIAPPALVMLVRYAAPYDARYYLLRFVHGDESIFGGFTFIGPMRELLEPEQVEELLTQVRAGEPPQRSFRAIKNPLLPLASRK